MKARHFIPENTCLLRLEQFVFILDFTLLMQQGEIRDKHRQFQLAHIVVHVPLVAVVGLIDGIDTRWQFIGKEKTYSLYVLPSSLSMA